MQQYIDALNLQPHPEGGFYKEVYRSAQTISGGKRNLMTSIYFLLTSETVSKFHRIKSDELWFHHAGSPLVVHVLDENGHHQNLVGSDINGNIHPQFMVPKNTIFGSTVLEENSFTLVSCVVAPGFDFEDFELITTENLLEMFPKEEEIIRRLS